MARQFVPLMTLLYLMQIEGYSFGRGANSSGLLDMSSDLSPDSNSMGHRLVRNIRSSEPLEGASPECSLSALFKSYPNSVNVSQFRSVQLTAADLGSSGCDSDYKNQHGAWYVLDGILTMSSREVLLRKPEETPSRYCVHLQAPPLTMIVLQAVNMQSWMKADNRTEVTLDGNRYKLEALANGGEVVVNSSDALLTVDNLFEKFQGSSETLMRLTLAFQAVPPCWTKPPRKESEAPWMDLVFILDASASVTEPNFAIMKNFIKDFVEMANFGNGNVRMGVIIYSTEAHIQFYLKSYKTKEGILDAVNNIPYRFGSTNTADALKAMRKKLFTAAHGDRPGVPNYAIIMSDGASNINSRRTIPEAEQARHENITIVAIGIGLMDTRELIGMASKPVHKYLFPVQDFTDLARIRDKVFSVFFSDFYKPTKAPVTKPGASCPTNHLEVECTNEEFRGSEVDLVFILDSSTSVTERNFAMMKDFIKAFVEMANFDNGNVRMGVIIYSTEAHIQFYLNSYNTKQDVMDAVNGIPYRFGSTNTADALKAMRTELFTEAHGDRPDISNYAIVITDGVSNINSRRTIPEAKQAQQENITIVAIGIGLTDTMELDGIASKPVDKHRFTVQDFADLARKIRNKVYATFYRDSSNEQKAHSFKVMPSCPTNLLQVKCPREGFVESMVDLVIILDASTSITEPNFVIMTEFVMEFVEMADIDNGGVRIGAIVYSTEAHIQFYLNSFTTKQEVVDAVINLPYRYGSTNTADALKVMRTELFTEPHGDRPEVPNYAVLITDGVSNINSRRTIPEADQVRRENINIFAIGIGLTDTRELDGIACKPLDMYRFTVQDFTELPRLRDKIFSAFHPGYIQTTDWNGQTPYHPTTDACVTIIPPPDNDIMTSFVTLDLEICDDCQCDSVEVYLTSACTGEPEYIICDFLEAQPAVYETKIMSVRFKSNKYIQRSGFKFLFSFHSSEDPPKRLRSGRWVCSGDRGDLLVKHFICSLGTFCVNAEDNAGVCPPQDLCGDSSVVVNEKCYRYIRPGRKISWIEASNMCKATKGSLFSLNTELEWKTVADFWTNLTHGQFLMVGLTQGIHSGLPDMYSSLWRWSDETIAYFTNISYPPEQIYPPYCAVFEGEQQQLTISPCNSPMEANFLCEMRVLKGTHEGLKQRSEIVLSAPLRAASTRPQMSKCPNNVTTYTFLQCDQLSHCYGDDKHEIEQCLSEHPEVAETMFTCRSQKQLVHYTLVCDHRPDCFDASDEDFCALPPCPASRFSCWKTKQCLSRDLRCDGVRHCFDGSDEQLCGESMEISKWNTVPPPAIINFTGSGNITVNPVKISHGGPVCPETHFQCPGDGYCLPVYVRCNGVFDCPGKEDEADCSSYTCPGFYRCRGADNCLHADHLCDGVFQCPRHDDELMCELACPASCTCMGFAFICLNRFPADHYPQLRYMRGDNTGMNLQDFANSTQLIYLRLRFCNIKEISYVSLPNLQSLDLSYNSLTNVTFNTLGKMRNLLYLSLAFNKLLSLDATENVCIIHPGLIFLDMSGGSTREITNTTFLSVPNIQYLNLSSSKLSRVWEPGFNTLPDLRVLDLTECPVTEFHGNLFKSLTNLEVIHTSRFHMCCPLILPEGFNHENCHAPPDEVSSCTALLRTDIFRVFLVMYALFALLGNFISFIYRVFGKGLTKKLGFDIFVTHLCVSDFLMGVYLAIVGVADRIYYGTYEWTETRWKHSIACQIAGFLSFVSSEVSAFLICFITLERFLLIRFPHKDLRFTPKSARIACILGWMVGLVLAAIPFLPFTPPWDFYSQTGICIPLPITRKVFPGSEYAFLVMIAFNFILFLLIAAGQFLIFWSIHSQTKAVSSSSKKAKDMAVARRLLAVVMSDFLCWFPIGLLGLMARSGTPISGDINVAMAIFILPFNSALNPFLYTFHMLIERRRMARAKSSDKSETMSGSCPTCARREQGGSQDASSYIKAQGTSQSATFMEGNSTEQDALKLVEQFLEENLMTPERLQLCLSKVIRDRNSGTVVDTQ